MSESFWAAKMAPTQPAEPVLPRGDGTAYRAWQRSKSANGASGSRIYDLPVLPEQRAQAQPQQRYVPGYDTANGLASYQNKAQPSRFAYDPASMSPQGYASKLTGAGLLDQAGQLRVENVGLLSEGDRAAVIAGYVELEQAGQPTHQDQRAIIDRIDGQANGVQQLGHRVSQGQRFDGREIDKLGGLPQPAPISGVNMASRSDIHAALQADEQRVRTAIQARMAASSSAIANYTRGN